jgi:hypothetical protein
VELHELRVVAAAIDSEGGGYSFNAGGCHQVMSPNVYGHGAVYMMLVKETVRKAKDSWNQGDDDKHACDWDNRTIYHFLPPNTTKAAEMEGKNASNVMYDIISMPWAYMPDVYGHMPMAATVACTMIVIDVLLRHSGQARQKHSSVNAVLSPESSGIRAVRKPKMPKLRKACPPTLLRRHADDAARHGGGAHG